MPTLSWTLRDLPVAERPRERLARLGPETLSAQELLAVLLGRGIAGESVWVTAQRLLASFGDLEGLSRASVEELSQVHGVGLAKATQLRAAFELGVRCQERTSQPQATVETAEAAAALLQPRLQRYDREHFVACFLDSRHGLIRIEEIAVGTLNASLVHPREVFHAAIQAQAASLLVAHNHPSGDPDPSEDDLALTRRLIHAGELLGMALLDHLIIGRGRWLSLRASRLIDEWSSS